MVKSQDTKNLGRGIRVIELNTFKNDWHIGDSWHLKKALLWARHCSEHFTCANLVKSHKESLRKVCYGFHFTDWKDKQGVNFPQLP